MPATRDQPHERCLLRPVFFMLFALLVRGGALAAQFEKLSADPDGYRALAGNLVRHGVLGRDQHPTAYRPPLYPLVLTACLTGPWQPQTAIAILHLTFGMATVWLTYSLGRRWQLGGFAYLAGILVACDPILLHQASLVMTETLATFLAVVSLTLASAAASLYGRRRIMFGALTSISLAMAALCRPTFLVSLLFFAAALAWTLPRWRQRLQVAAVMAVAALLVLLPWAARNVVVFGKPIITTTHGGYTLLLGNNDDYYEFLRTKSWRSVWRADRLDASLRAAPSEGEVADDRHLYELAWQTIRRQPSMFLYASLRRVCALWGLLPHRINLNESPLSGALRLATAVWYSIVFVLGLTAIGCGAIRMTRPPWLWAMMLAASFTAVHVLYWTDMRMRAPLIPAIALVAAAGAKRLYFPRLFMGTSKMQSIATKPVVAVLTVIVLILLGVAVVHWMDSRLAGDQRVESGPGGAASTGRENTVPDSIHDTAPAGFREDATAKGLDFQMTFLAGEQGENFKINLYDHGCGLAVADYDGDGDDDLLLLNQLGANALYRNRGDGSFERDGDETSPVALADRICVGAAFGDYDNDGDQDLYITSTRGGNVLFQNEEGQFRDVTEQAGVALIAHSQTPAFFDYDNDGDLDLYVTNTAKWTSDEFDRRDNYYVGPRYLREFLEGGQTDLEYNVLFQNDGQGHFTDVTREAGLEGRGWCGDLAVFDYDDDGDLDLFVANMFGLGQLYRNEGNGRFQDVTRQTLGRTSFGAIGSKAFDYDNDGRLDLFVTDMHSDMWEIPKRAELVEEGKKLADVEGGWRQILRRDFGESYRELFLFGNSLFHNEGRGAFTETSDAAGLETFWPWGIAVGDFNNDGNQDAFLASGMGYPFFYWRNYLMLNRGDGTFADAAAREGIEPPPGGQYLPQPIGGKPAARSSRCAVAGDFDSDGRLDLIANNFNDRPYYYINQFPRRHYVAFRLRGTRSNRDAIGASVRLHVGRQTLVRQVDCAGGYLSQSSKTLHFGLGHTETIERVEIRWPSGARQTLSSLEVDRLHEVIEPAENGDER